MEREVITLGQMVLLLYFTPLLLTTHQTTYFYCLPSSSWSTFSRATSTSSRTSRSSRTRHTSEWSQTTQPLSLSLSLSLSLFILLLCIIVSFSLTITECNFSQSLAIKLIHLTRYHCKSPNLYRQGNGRIAGKYDVVTHEVTMERLASKIAVPL